MTRGRIIAGIAGVTAALVLAVLVVSKVSSIKTGQAHNQQAANTTNQQTGTVNPLVYKLVYLDGVKRVINPSLQQVRTSVESEGCILVYNRAGRFVGKSCAGANETIRGLGYSAKTESGIRMMVFLTVCPLGSPGFNSGSCN